jgi:hypothetical protein
MLAGAGWGGQSHPSTATADTLKKYITDCSPEDTIYLPDGNYHIDTVINITKGISIFGSNCVACTLSNYIDSTLYPSYIRRNIFRYSPADYNSNHRFELRGVTFNLRSKGAGITIGSSSKDAPFKQQTKIIIQHCSFINDTTDNYQGIWNYGGCNGVVSHCYFGLAYPIRNSPQVSNGTWWNNFIYLQGVDGGDSNNLYFEDNVFEKIRDGTSSSGILMDGQFSGRYVFRYNTVVPDQNMFGLLDLHGNQPSGYSCFGAEIYGNRIIAGSHLIQLLGQRGGKAKVFFNKIIGSNSSITNLREEFYDSISPTTSLQPQHVSESYYWNNRDYDNDLLSPYVSGDSLNYGGNVGWVPQKDRDYYYQVTAFDGSTGCGCGTYEEMITIASPDSGVGFWVTSQGCDSINVMVHTGADAQPIRGELYVYNKYSWIKIYEPYTYPNPLVGGIKNMKMNIKRGVR